MAGEMAQRFDGRCAQEISRLINSSGYGFDGEAYAAAVDQRVPGLALRERLSVLTQELWRVLPDAYLTALDILLASLGPELSEDQGIINDGWYLAPIAQFVQDYGLEYPRESLEAIERITRRHTGEFAIRPYLTHWHDMTMEYVNSWAQSDSFAVRRLASESIRPRLPWAPRYIPFEEDPAPIIGIIEQLINDPSAFVRKSVANNLNDISKAHPEFAISTAQRWLEISSSNETMWIVHHGLRTLIKAGHHDSLDLLGMGPTPHLQLEALQLEAKSIFLGDSLYFSVTIHNDGPKELQAMIDYRVYFLKRTGILRPTTFKLRSMSIPPGGIISINKAHSFKPVSTRTYYLGEHALSILINGVESEKISFTLERPG